MAAHLLAHPDEASEIQIMRQQNEALRAFRADVLTQPVPERLSAVIDAAKARNGQQASRWAPRRLMPLAAAAVVLFSLGMSGFEAVRRQLTGKILIDATVPLMPPKVGTVQLPELGSAAQESQAYLGDDVIVVSAFHNIGADHLQSDHEIECDVLVTGNKADARETVIGLVEAAGLKGWHAGPLANSAAAEALTSELIGINRRYKTANAGIRITGANSLS